jgi:hypothetical protein
MDLLTVSGGTNLADLQSPTTPAFEQGALSARKHSTDQNSGEAANPFASTICSTVNARLMQRLVADQIRELQSLVKDARNNRSKILKVLEDLTIYFATETFNDERHQFASASVSGKSLSATMYAFFSSLVACKKYFTFHNH